MTALHMSILLLALLNLSSALVCPDGGTCEDRNTCCRNTAGGYGCCPLPHAECCSDHLHCCYKGTLCDLEHHKCVNKTVSLPWVSRLPAVPQVHARMTEVICPDSKFHCPNGTTCCQFSSSSWGCCLFSSAVCCKDKIHCCPEGTRCDLTHYKCVSPSQQWFPMMQKVPATRRTELQVASIVCPDGKSRCSDGSTCCQLSSGDYGCCPYEQAVCCNDHMHCCPAGTQCDLEHSMCTSGGVPVPLLKKITADPKDVSCPDQSQCPDQTTCCQMAAGSYGCCPMPNAVCCSDQVHCCPTGTQCDLTLSICVPGGPNSAVKIATAVGLELLALKSSGDTMTPVAPALTSGVHGEQCDKQTSCPGSGTCCKKLSGQWACCPLHQAVCCNNGEHCCPKGSRCNLKVQTCEMASGASLPWMRKVPAQQEEPSRTVSGPAQPTVVMCDNRTSCPRHTSCCFMQRTHKWGCCPIPNAVCCEDGDHCCPRGHRCDPHRRSCSKGFLVMPWFTKLSAVTQPDAVADIKCDDRSSCPAGTTCCKLKSGDWGCCPLVKAVCCSDHEHCCPQGYSCNMQTGTCEKKDHGVLVFSVPQRRVLGSKSSEAEGLVSCGDTGEVHCPKEHTCCPLSATEWACCPSLRAVCCSDQKHCCPAGFSCDLVSGGCVQDLSSRDIWFDREASKPLVLKEDATVTVMVNMKSEF